MEVQLTDFENAAFTAFIVIVTRAILVFNLSLLQPLSKVDESLGRLQNVSLVSRPFAPSRPQKVSGPFSK